MEMESFCIKYNYSRRHFLKLLGGGMSAAMLPGFSVFSGDVEAEALHKAEFYDKLADQHIRCRLCPRRCVVAPGRRGFCRVRENRDGEYFSLVYGLPCVRNVDPIEKKPFFHVLPGTRTYSIATVGCNFSCRFCQNWDIAMAGPEDVNITFRKPEEIADAAKDTDCKLIAYTYNEPTVFYEYMRDCARAGRERGIGSVMVSNGYIETAPQKELLPLMRAVKVDLKSFNPEFYTRICGGKLKPVLDSLLRLRDSGVWYEIVVLVIPGVNDGADEIRRMAEWIVRELGPDVPVHFSRFHPTYKMRNVPPTAPALLEKCRETAMDRGCNFVYIGNVPGDAGQNTCCPGCGRILVRRVGYHILENHISKGCCDKCGRVIPGVWSVS